MRSREWTYSDNSSDDTHHISNRLPRVLADALIGNTEHVLALERVDEDTWDGLRRVELSVSARVLREIASVLVNAPYMRYATKMSAWAQTMPFQKSHGRRISARISGNCGNRR